MTWPRCFVVDVAVLLLPARSFFPVLRLVVFLPDSRYSICLKVAEEQDATKRKVHEAVGLASRWIWCWLHVGLATASVLLQFRYGSNAP